MAWEDLLLQGRSFRDEAVGIPQVSKSCGPAYSPRTICWARHLLGTTQTPPGPGWHEGGHSPRLKKPPCGFSPKVLTPAGLLGKGDWKPRFQFQFCGKPGL